MAYRIELEREARKAIKGLSGKLRDRIVKKIDALAADPRPLGCEPLRGTAHPWYRVRVGPYRIIYEIRDEVLIVLILRISSRGDVYDHLNG